MKKSNLEKLQRLERKWHDNIDFNDNEKHEFVTLFKERVQEFIKNKCE